MRAMVKGVEPKDQVEAMLAAQMVAVHNATMTFARRLNHVENIPQQDIADCAFNVCLQQAMPNLRGSGGGLSDTGAPASKAARGAIH